MPHYSYLCENDHGFEQWASIHVDSMTAECPYPECGLTAGKVFTPPMISVYATPSKGADARAVDKREKNWSRDLPAYKALRNNGVQPPAIDGCHRLEAAETPLEVEMGQVLKNHEERDVAMDTHAELQENKRQPDLPGQLGKYRKETTKRKVRV